MTRGPWLPPWRSPYSPGDAGATQFTLALSSLQSGVVPAMTLSFATTMLEMRTLILEEGGLGSGAVFAGATPADASLRALGLLNCSGATGRINATSHQLIITLPSACVIVANALVTLEIPEQFFLPNPAVGITIELTIRTDLVNGPTATIQYTTGVCALPLPFPLRSSMPIPSNAAWGLGISMFFSLGCCRILGFMGSMETPWVPRGHMLPLFVY